MERKHWKQTYSYFPHFPCPRCSKGSLKRIVKDIDRREPKHVTMALQEEQLQGEVSEGRFVCMLVCDYRPCGEVVSVGGDYRSHADVQYGEEGTWETVDLITFQPKSMHPAPPIITWPRGLDSIPRKHLIASFGLFWADLAACANRLRIVVETLLDQLKIPTKGIKRDKKNGDLDLSERISALDVAKPGYGESLNALRHVGNYASHEGEGNFEDMLTCFELFEYTLIELLEDRRGKLQVAAAELIARKGRPSS